MKIISQETLNNLDGYAEEFNSAKPFKHVLMKNFFDDSFGRAILKNFPAIENPECLINEFGDKSRKAAFHNVRDLGSVFVELDNYVKSPQFLKLMSRITGIPDLMYDPEYHGAGTHENLNGQGMDTHIDFNYHRTTGLHRRLNAIIYLNEEWVPDWGGAIELHKNPWNVDEDWWVSFLPLFNHCVLFETNEYSWHGFSPVNVPPDRKVISRKSFTIYFYSKERPKNEVAEKHGTIYIQSGLPRQMKVGHELSDTDISSLKNNFNKRNNYLAAMYRREKQFHNTIKTLRFQLDRLQEKFSVPVYGNAVSGSPVTGIYPDMSASSKVSIPILSKQPLTSITLHGIVPDWIETNSLSVSIDGSPVVDDCSVQGDFSLEVPLPANCNKKLELVIYASKTMAPIEVNKGEDRRQIAFRFKEIECE